MQWTGVRYAEKPEVEVETWIAAPVETVWPLVSDINLMPSLSAELQSVEWRGGASEPAVGAAFVGHNKHEALGEWSTTSHIVEYDPPRTFAWAVENPQNPTATWRFRVQPDDGGTRLYQWVQMGPGRSGLSIAIEAMPDREQKIVFVRLREFERGMTENLAQIKARAEGAR